MLYSIIRSNQLLENIKQVKKIRIKSDNYKICDFILFKLISKIKGVRQNW